RFPLWNEPHVGVGFHEINARKSDFAFASAAAQVALDRDGTCRRAALAVGAVTPCPVRLDRVSDALIGKRIEESAVRSAIEIALADVESMSDLHASADYRRRVATTLAVRALMDADKAARHSHAR